MLRVKLCRILRRILDSTARDSDAESLADISKRKPIVGYQNVKFPPSAADAENFCAMFSNTAFPHQRLILN